MSLNSYQSKADVNLTNGLVSYWTFDTNAATQLDNASLHNATNSGATYTASGKIGGAFTYDTGTTYMTVGGTYTWASGDMTVATWYKSTDTDQPDYGSYFLKPSFYGLAGDTLDHARFNGATGTSDVADTNWKFIVGQRCGNSRDLLWVNNILETNATAGAALDTASYQIGRDGFNTARGADGTIDEMGVWDRCLNATEISTLYNNGTGIQYPFTTAVVNNFTITGNILYNSTAISNANVSLLSDYGASVISSVQSNSTGGYTFGDRVNQTYYVVLATYNHTYTASGYVYVNATAMTKNLDFYSTGTSTTVYPSCFVFASGCYAYTTLLSNNCALISR